MNLPGGVKLSEKSPLRKLNGVKYYVDQANQNHQAQLAKHPIVHTCIKYHAHSFQEAKFSAHVSLGNNESIPFGFLQTFIRSSGGLNVSLWATDYQTYGFALIHYRSNRDSKRGEDRVRIFGDVAGVLAMTNHPDDEEISEQSKRTKRAIDPKKKDLPETYACIENPPCVPMRLDPLHYRVFFTLNSRGEPKEFMVFPKINNEGRVMKVATADSEWDLHPVANVRVIMAPDVFSVDGQMLSRLPTTQSHAVDDTAYPVSFNSDVSRCSDEVAQLEFTKHCINQVLYRSMNPDFAIVPPLVETKESPGEILQKTFLNQVQSTQSAQAIRDLGGQMAVTAIRENDVAMKSHLAQHASNILVGSGAGVGGHSFGVLNSELLEQGTPMSVSDPLNSPMLTPEQKELLRSYMAEQKMNPAWKTNWPYLMLPGSNLLFFPSTSLNAVHLDLRASQEQNIFRRFNLAMRPLDAETKHVGFAEAATGLKLIAKPRTTELQNIMTTFFTVMLFDLFSRALAVDLFRFFQAKLKTKDSDTSEKKKQKEKKGEEEEEKKSEEGGQDKSSENVAVPATTLKGGIRNILEEDPLGMEDSDTLLKAEEFLDACARVLRISVTITQHADASMEDFADAYDKGILPFEEYARYVRSRLGIKTGIAPKKPLKTAKQVEGENEEEDGEEDSEEEEEEQEDEEDENEKDSKAEKKKKKKKGADEEDEEEEGEDSKKKENKKGDKEQEQEVGKRKKKTQVKGKDKKKKKPRKKEPESTSEEEEEEPAKKGTKRKDGGGSLEGRSKKRKS